MSTLTKVKIYVIDPSWSENLMTNPSQETGLTGYTGVNCTLGSVTTYARRGKTGMSCTPGTAAKSYVYATTQSLTSGTIYSLGVDVLGGVGIPFSIEFHTTGDVFKAETQFNGNGYWQRKYVTWTADANAQFRVQVAREANASLALFYTDGWQLEVGQPTTYLDGDMVGHFPTLQEYRWEGEAHNSKSIREATTRTGGLFVDLQTLFYKIGIQGLGLPGFTINATEVAQGGEVYQNTHLNPRDFSILYAMDGVLPGDLYAKIKTLVHAFNPKRMKLDQPIRLYIVGQDANGVEQSEGVFIDCHYKSGLEINDTTYGFARGSINLRMSDPIIKVDGDTVIALPAGADRVRTTDYRVEVINEATGAVSAYDGFNNNVNGIVPGKKNSHYIFGAFTGFGGANGNRFIMRNYDGTYTAIGTGAADGSVYAAYYAADNWSYILGSFTGYGGVANTTCIAGFYTDNVPAALGTGLYRAVTPRARAIVGDFSGNIYVGGLFDKFNGVGGTTCNNFAMFASSGARTWSVCGGGTPGVDGEVITLERLGDGRIALGGAFLNAGGASMPYLAIWTGTAYVSIGAPNGQVSKIVYDKATGRIYVVGSFTSIAGVSTPGGVAYYDGVNWHSMPGLTSLLRTDALWLTANGQPAVVAQMPGFVQSSVIVFDGTYWHPMDLVFADTCFMGSYDSFRNQTVLCITRASNLTFPSTVTVQNSGDGDIYPRVIMSSAGYNFWSLHNRATGERIYLNGLKCGIGENIELKCTQTGYNLVSDIRGDISGLILPGSSPTFHLKPGTNYVSCFIASNPNGSPAVTLKYPAGNYYSLYEAFR